MSVGLGLAALLTVVSFLLPALNLVWAPSLPVALAVLAIAQMGVHVVFFLHVTTGPDNVNNVMALAFGVLIVVPGDRRLAVDHARDEREHDEPGMPNM